MKKGSFWIKSLPVYIAILLGSFLIGWFSQSDLKQIITPQGVKNNPKILLNQLLACPPGESSSSYKCTVPLVNAYLKKNNVEPLFELIKKEYKTNPEVGNYCHPLGHTIGRAMYQKYGYVDSLNMCDPFCAAGCTMGVMESFLFANKEIHPTNDRIMEKADEACEEFAQGNIVKQAACIHGTGHGIMPLVLYKTQDALDLCKMLHSAQKGSCYDAVFMEKFLPTNPVRKVSKTKDLFEYCSL